MTDNRVAVVGAGVAGAGVAYALRDVSVSVTVFERTGRIGGRAATRSAHGCTYDPAANYVKSDDTTITNLITETLDTEGLIDVTEPVWTFTGDGTISPGNRAERSSASSEGRSPSGSETLCVSGSRAQPDDNRPMAGDSRTQSGDDTDAHKWSYEHGIAELPRRLFEESDATVVRNTPITAIDRDEDQWTLTGETDPLSAFDAVVLTPPAPQTATLLSPVEWDRDGREALQTAVEEIEYRSIYTVLLGYPFELDAPYYALVNTDREHEIGWLSREECKPGRVPDGESLLVVQMASDWSARRIETPSDETEIVREVAEETATLLDNERLQDPEWTDTAAWSHALPARDAGKIAKETRRPAEREGLFLAGDWVTGEGRIHRALQSGLTTGSHVVDRA